MNTTHIMTLVALGERKNKVALGTETRARPLRTSCPPHPMQQPHLREEEKEEEEEKCTWLEEKGLPLCKPSLFPQPHSTLGSP